MSDTTPIQHIGRISHFFTVNRPLSLIVLIGALLFGLLAFTLTPKQYNPEIVRPAFAIHITYQGATADAAIDRVVYELVEKIHTVPGVDDIYTDVQDGAHINTTVIFEVGYDATKAKVDLLSHLEQQSYAVQGFISQPQIIEINPETIPILQIVFSSDTYSLSELREHVTALSHKLGRIDNVSETSVYGGYNPTIVIEVDPAKLTAANLTLTDIQQSLAASQHRFVSDNITSNTTRISMVYDGRARTTDAIGMLLVGETTRLRDVATIYEGTTGDRPFVQYQHHTTAGEVVMLSVAKVEGSSAPQVATAVLNEIDALTHEPAFTDLSYQVVSNDGATAAREINGLTTNLLSSIVIVAGVLLLFLSVRAAAVVLVAIPVTLLLVFALGWLFGQTINRITLFALILSLGLLVDSAIVVVENIYSHLKAGEESGSPASRERLVAHAVDEIGIGLLLSTVTSVIVFLPMNYITGMMGPYMGPIAFFVPAALIISLLVAIIVTPFVAAHTLKVTNTQNRLTRFFSTIMERLTRHYTHFLRSVLTVRSKQVWLLRGALLLFLCAIALPLFGLVHFQMLPKADRDQLYVYIDLPTDTTIATTQAISNDIVNLLVVNNEVINIQSFIATAPIVDFNGMFKGAQSRTESYQATLRVNLTSAHERADSSTDITSALRHTVAEHLPEFAPYIRFMEEPPGPPVRATLVAKILTPDNTLRTQSATDLKRYIADIPGVVDVYISDDASIGRVRYELDYAAASALGVSPASVLSTLAVTHAPQTAGELLSDTATEFTSLTLSLPVDMRDAPSDISLLTVRNYNGTLIPLSAVLTTHYEVRPSKVTLEGITPITYVTSEVEGRSIVYVVIEILRGLLAGQLDGYDVSEWGLFHLSLTTPTGEVIELAWGGEWEMTLENFRDLGAAMGVALLLVYAVLVAQYKSFSIPAYILVTVPLGLIGILFGFLLLDQGFGIYLTATALIGFIALIGLVVNNAIIFLEYVEQAERAGATFVDALVAAGEARLRPIFLTSLTTILGSLTIASDPVWSGLAWAIIFGLSLSTILTLVIYPTLLVYFKKK